MALRNLVLAIVFGSISSFGFFAAPTLTAQVVDRVSSISVADSTKYANVRDNN